MTLTVLHIGSWGSDPGRASREMIDDVEFRDVTFYPGKSFAEILDLERPDAAVLLSTQTFAHRAFLRYCGQRAIPTLHLYHGVVNVQVTDDVIGSHKPGALAYARYVAPKLWKLATRTFPAYTAALLRTGATRAEWRRFLADVVRMARGRPALRAADDARTTKGAVYTKADVEHAMRMYGLRAEEVAVVGNPDLARFGFKSQMLGVLNRRTTDHERVMYIDTALAVVGLLFKSRTSFVRHLIDTSRSLAVQGKRMAFKPHPAHDRAFLQESLKDTGIELVSNDEFLGRLMQCCACIAETTSLSLVPALMGMPLLLARHGELSEQRFGPVLTGYPRAYVLDDVSRVADILRTDAERFDAQAVNEWIAFNSGPLPAEEMPRRVAEVIESMTSKTS